MKIDEIRAMGTDELTKKIDDSHKDLLDLRFKLATKQLVNHREIRRMKKEIARMETVLSERTKPEVG